MNNLNDINWNHLFCFYEVAKAQSLKKAAAFLQTAPSTLSEKLKKLELNFNKKLFIRSSNGLKLTIDGEILFDQISSIFENGRKVIESFSDDIVGGYPVQIGIEETFSTEIATEFASQYWDSYAPFGTVNTLRQVEHEVLVENIVQDKIDFGLSLRVPRRKNLEYAEVDSFEIVFCCSSELYEKFKNKNDILINIPFAQAPWDKSLNDSIYEHLRKNGIRPKEKIVSDHPDFLKKLCERGRCVMFLPKNPLDDYAGLKTFQLGTPLRIALYAIWKREREGLVSIKKLRELINSKLSQLPDRYSDVDLQIEVSDVSDDLLV